MADLAPPPEPAAVRALRQDLIRVSKKKGCKQSKCSHWKGGCCRCGRD
ncbi:MULTISPECIES: hypothetical protein [unclassified Synechococcus]|nr:MULTISPECIES: hypothetical protein [unclassified Synechococcus]MCT0214029.1 hypothetical protein [Synechococcus sp. CS-1326]MCT0233605.1 hypothetical protein [Synechococcus sp. CS-1327]